MQITGSCHCGQITYRADINPSDVIICHCTDCQVLSGSAFRSIVMSLPGAFEFTSGSPSIYVKTADSGNRREQTFCSTCGSPIYSTSDGDEPKHYGIRLGTVTERNELRPSSQIWHKSAQAWVKDVIPIPSEDGE